VEGNGIKSQKERTIADNSDLNQKKCIKVSLIQLDRLFSKMIRGHY